MSFTSALCNFTTADLNINQSGVMVNRSADNNALCLCGQKVFQHPPPKQSIYNLQN
jgi:hypothetical protein